MKRQLKTTIVLLLFSLNSFAQDDLKLRFIMEKPASSAASSEDTIRYPVFTFTNKTISDKINAEFEKEFKRFFDIEDSIRDIPSILKKAAEAGLVWLEYQMHRNDANYFSFSMAYEGIGVYLSSWEICYCFDKRTGNLLSLDSLLSPGQETNFLWLLKQKQKEKIDLYRRDLKKQLEKKEIDQDVFNTAISIVKGDCWSHYYPREFKILRDKVEIIIDCEFPHAIRNISPENSLFLSLTEIRQYLKPRHRNL